MGQAGGSNASVPAYLTPATSPVKPATRRRETCIGDGFTDEELQAALKPQPVESWQPELEYADREISDLTAGPNAVTFMGRIANIFDVVNAPRSPRSARGCLKLVVKDGAGAITVRLWYVSRIPCARLGSLVSIWTNHVSNGENGSLSSASAPLFASLFPERDRNCHLFVHQNSDDGRYRTPLGYREHVPLNSLMTLQSFTEGGYDVLDAKVLVVVKSIGAKKQVTRRDESVTENVTLQIHDDTAEATLGLWGTAASSPADNHNEDFGSEENGEPNATDGWKPGHTTLLLQGPGCKIGRTTYISLTSTTIVDVDPAIPDAEWLRRWAIRQRSREAINPLFPDGIFDLDIVTTGPVRCLFTIADLDEFARCAPTGSFQGYLSLLVMEFKLVQYWKRQMLFSGECCTIPMHVNATSAICKGCDKEIPLRLNPRIVGQVLDETAVIEGGKLLFSDQAWRELLGRDPEDLLKLQYEELKYLADRILFCRISVIFGWTADESKAGGRICVLGIRA